MDNMSGLEKIYAFHHKNERGRGFVLLPTARGAYLCENIGKNKKILDLGCRDGSLTQAYYKENDVLGVDIDSEALEIAQKNLGIQTKQINLNDDWSLPENSFDIAVAAEVIEHVYYPKIFIEKIANVLKRDGILVGSIPNAFSLINRFRYLFGKKNNTPLGDPTHINHFSRKEFETILKDKFRKVELVPVGRYSFLEKFFPGFFAFIYLFKAEK